MLKTTKQPHWISFLLTLIALVGFTSLCHAQSPINYTFPSDLQGWTLNEPGGETDATISWNSTNSSTGGGCMQLYMDGTNTTELDPWVTLPTAVNENNYIEVTIHMMVAANSSTSGNFGSGGYGYLQIALRNSSFSFDSIQYGTIYPSAANQWETYSFVMLNPYKTAEQYLQMQLGSGAGYTNTVNGVTVYIDNVSIVPLPDPWLMEPFTAQDGGIGSWDSTVDAPFFNPINGAGPTNITPAGSWENQISNPGGYSGFNQYTPPQAMDLTRFQNFGFDVYLDGSSGSTYGGFQLLFFENGYSGLVNLGTVSFNSSMVGKWTHFNFPSASLGITACPSFAIQGTPGSDGGSDTTTFHIDNLVFWSPQTAPKITSFTPNTTPGGLKMQVDGDGTANEFDQEGIATPSATNNVADFFWTGQTPATYSFTLTNFPAPAVAPGFEAHAYVINGDSLVNDGQSFSYNQTYSGPNFNTADGIWFSVQNGTNGGVNADLLWKTNAPNSNMTNGIFCSLPGQASANGKWALNFSSDTAGTITFNGTVVTNFTLPAFTSDPNYNANFTPATSFVAYGVWKNDGNTNLPGINDNQSAIFTSVLATNTTVAISDNFSGSSLTASNAWQVAVYYQDAANRTTLIPAGTAFWLTWNTTQAGFNVQSTTNLSSGTWTNAGVSFTYVDGTGTNTIGAIPSSTLPPGGADFFDLLK